MCWLLSTWKIIPISFVLFVLATNANSGPSGFTFNYGADAKSPSLQRRQLLDSRMLSSGLRVPGRVRRRNLASNTLHSRDATNTAKSKTSHAASGNAFEAWMHDDDHFGGGGGQHQATQQTQKKTKTNTGHDSNQAVNANKGVQANGNSLPKQTSASDKSTPSSPHQQQAHSSKVESNGKTPSHSNSKVASGSNDQASKADSTSQTSKAQVHSKDQLPHQTHQTFPQKQQVHHSKLDHQTFPQKQQVHHPKQDHQTSHQIGQAQGQQGAKVSKDGHSEEEHHSIFHVPGQGYPPPATKMPHKDLDPKLILKSRLRDKNWLGQEIIPETKQDDSVKKAQQSAKDDQTRRLRAQAMDKPAPQIKLPHRYTMAQLKTLGAFGGGKPQDSHNEASAA